jgi:uncharacterized protein YggE
MRILVPALLAALVLSAPAFAQDPALRPATLAVTGTGEAQLKPDFARILVAVGTQADTVAQAVEANRTATERVMTRIQALGLKREDIQSANFQVFQTPPRIGKDGREQPVPRFTVRHQLRVITRDINGVGRLAGEILASGDMTFQSLAWGLDRQEQGADEARRGAVRDARRQAEVYADAAGVRLGRLLEVREGSVHLPAEKEADMSLRMSAADAATEVPIVPPATVRYEATVQLVFEIAP